MSTTLQHLILSLPPNRVQRLLFNDFFISISVKTKLNHLAQEFEETEDGIFRFIRGPANQPGKPAPCSWKLCMTATDENYLVETLFKISQRPDCFFVKYSPSTSPKSRDGMMLGRVFLTTEEKIGDLWRQLYGDRKLMCSIQDDGATEKFRKS